MRYTFASSMALLVCVACDPMVVEEDTPITFDATPSDGGPDTPPELDGGDGTCGESITLDGWGALPETCLPRCMRATGETYEACAGVASCIGDVLRADATETVTVRTYAGIFAVSCGGSESTYGCVDWQTFSCEAEACPDAYRAWATCSAAMNCTDERATLDTCIEGASVYPICIDELVGDCFSEL
jgi:hypothetical protein